MDIDTQNVLYEILELMEIICKRIDDLSDHAVNDSEICVQLLDNIRNMLDELPLD